MDFIKNAVDQAKGAVGGDKNKDKNNQNKEDYVDKAFDYASKQSGHSINRDTQEKITDGAREQYEKYTGNKVSDKISN